MLSGASGMLEAMTMPRVHLRLTEPADGRSHTLCGVASLTWTRDPQAVTCPRCVSLIDAQPA